MRSKTTLIGMLIVLNLARLLAQNDSIKIEFSQEKITKESRLNQTLCEILTKREKQEKELWKINLLGIFISEYNFNLSKLIDVAGYINNGLCLSYERKFSPAWSWNLSSITGYRDGIGGKNAFNQSFSGELRYYYNVHKRMRLGKKAGFSGNYFGLLFDNSYNSKPVVSGYGFDTTGYGNHGADTIYSIKPRVYSTHHFSHSLNITYGIQRKIGKVGYVDCAVGFGGIFKYGTDLKTTYNIATGSINESIKPYKSVNYMIRENLLIKLAVGACF